MFYELRLYKSAPGRLHEIDARMGSVYPPLFRRAGFHTPLGQWNCTSGAMMPLYVWLVRWDSHEHRQATFDALYKDPDWARLRAETNGPSEMVLGFNLYLLEGTPAQDTIAALHADRAGPAGGLHELRLYSLYPGRAEQAMQSLRETHLPALKRAGGVSLGAFKVSIGPNLPCLALFMAWEGYEAREAGLAAHAADAEVKACLAREAAELKTELLGRHESWLMRPTTHCPPQYHFAAAD